MKTTLPFIVLAAMALSQIYASPIPDAEAEAIADAEPRRQQLTPQKRQIAVPVSAKAAYQYQWEVSDPTGNNFYGAGEKRDGAITSGSYFVLLPDGRRQRVDYTVNAADGYVATVTYN